MKHHVLNKAFHFFGNSLKTHMTNRNRKYVRLNVIDYFHLDGGPALWRVRLDAGVVVCCLPLLWVFVSALIDEVRCVCMRLKPLTLYTLTSGSPRL